MNQDKLDMMLQIAIKTAKKLNIPVSDNIINRVSVNKKAKSFFGRCKNRSGEYEIIVTETLLKTNATKLILETLIHEVLHTCPNCMNHGKQWKRYAELVNKKYHYNIKRESTYEELEGVDIRKNNIRYLIRCTNPKCEVMYERERNCKLVEKIQNYRCGACKSPLELRILNKQESRGG